MDINSLESSKIDLSIPGVNVVIAVF